VFGKVRMKVVLMEREVKPLVGEEGRVLEEEYRFLREKEKGIKAV